MSRSRTSTTYRAGFAVIGSGLLALALYALYRPPRFGDGLEGWPNLMSQEDAALLLGLVLASALLCWLGRSSALAILERLATPIRRFGAWSVIALGGVAFVALALVADRVLDGFPNSGDEQALVLQAQTYATGKLWTEVPPLPDAFRMHHYFDVGDKWVSRYLPGWAALAAPFAALGLPLWIVNPLIGAIALIAFFYLARSYVSADTAWIGVLLLGTSSFFILNSASLFPHILTAFYGIVFAIFGSRYLAKGNAWHAIAAGAVIGLMGLTRIQNAVICLIPLAAAFAMTARGRTGLIWLGLGGLPFFLALLAYNDAITGDPLVTVQASRESTNLAYPDKQMIDLTVDRFAELMVWTSPLLALGYILAFALVVHRKSIGFTDWIMPATILFHLFYAGSGGNQYGPRYYFEAWPFVILTILKAVDPVGLTASRTRFAPWVASALVASLLFQIAYLPARFEREHRVVAARQHVYAEVERAELNNAIVIIASETGYGIRAMGKKDLLRNGPELDRQTIVYAVDVGEDNEKLTSLFPDRSVYVFGHGQLRPYR